MSEVCGVIADIKREAKGVYVFPRLTLLGFDKTDPEFRKLEEMTEYDFDDSDKRNEGVEVKNISPFCLIRDLARHLNYEPVKVVETEAPGDRCGLVWTMVVPEDGTGVESIGVVADLSREGEGEYVMPTSTVFGLTDAEKDALKSEGLEIRDGNRRVEGVEIHGASPFKIMRVLCGKQGWATDGEPVNTTVAEGKTSLMWTLSRKIQ